jgi:hypothetical protein
MNTDQPRRDPAAKWAPVIAVIAAAMAASATPDPGPDDERSR